VLRRIEHVDDLICLRKALLCARGLRQGGKQLQGLDTSPEWNARFGEEVQAVLTTPGVVASRIGPNELELSAGCSNGYVEALASS